jgi:hypothetical protein
MCRRQDPRQLLELDDGLSPDDDGSAASVVSVVMLWL